jgi:hypothetical protein
MTTANSKDDATVIPDLIAKVKASQAALGDIRDARSDNERADFWAGDNERARLISHLMNDPSDLARAQARLEDVEASRAETVAEEAALETTIANFEDWRAVPDARERDAEWTRQDQVRRRLQRLRNGTLLKGPGVAFLPLDYLDARIKELTAKRDQLRARLDEHVRQAEALLVAEKVTT